MFYDEYVMSLEEIRQERIKKLEKLRSLGINSYPAQTNRTHSVAEALKKFLALVKNKKKIRMAGRLMAKREHGGSAFFDLKDETGKIQIYFKKDILGDEYEKALEVLDVGDFLEAGGKLFKTKKGEATLEITEWIMLVKSLRPLPEKWRGLQDTEERFRRRYLDLLMNKDVRERFEMRSKIIRHLREFLDKKDFFEVETPILQIIPGGATARPFKTHLNALNLDLYLRIAPELYLKELLVGGFEKIYEIGRIFRNEGIDAVHNPEFTMLEGYIAYQDSGYLRSFLRQMLEKAVRKVNNSPVAVYEEKSIDFSKPFKEIFYDELIKESGDFDIAKKSLIQPTFISGFPDEKLPLAKAEAKNLKKADAFQVIAGGIELIKAFSEENDPLVQRERFLEQQKLRETGDEEAQRLDENFLEALEYGMPPACGFGIGVDRLAMLLTDAKNIREVVLFPTLKPK